MTLHVYCDESGNEGQNLFSAGSTVFTHAGTTVALRDADNVIKAVRQKLGIAASEVKARSLLKEPGQEVLRELLVDSRLQGKITVQLIDKRYFLTSKIIDLVVEELMFKRGVNMYANGRARHQAQLLAADGPVQLGQETFDGLLLQFNEIVRGRSDPAGLKQFTAKISEAIDVSTGKLRMVLKLVLTGIDELLDYTPPRSKHVEQMITLDPLLAAIGQTARTWAERSSQSIGLAHDQQDTLTPDRVNSTIRALRAPQVVDSSIPPVDIREIRFVESHLDSRIQIADIFAGAGREIAEAQLRGIDHLLTSDFAKFVDSNSIWGNDRSWANLTGASPV